MVMAQVPSSSVLFELVVYLCCHSRSGHLVPSARSVEQTARLAVLLAFMGLDFLPSVNRLKPSRFGTSR
jgi:hypothetical protein